MEKNRTPYLSTSRLKIGYANNQKENCLFENLDLALYPGQLVCFMGPNGIGKSSLIRTLSGLQNPLEGKIDIHHITGDKKRAQQISVVLTDRISVSNMTVYDVVAFGRYPYLDWNIRLSEADHEIIESSITLVHIEHLRGKKLQELSDGQLQMVMIARALAQDTPIILLDEPTAHLDLNNRVEIMKLLRKLSRTTHKAILVATHELDLALQLADWIWLTGRNKNILTGMPEELVLDGSFDAIFQFKGFDLRTGKVQHDKDKQISVSLTGDGHEYLWTKNALERHGFEITDQPGVIAVSIIRNEASTQWRLTKAKHEKSFSSLSELVNSI
jgi:iron complex transport system ATP-binding protein